MYAMTRMVDELSDATLDRLVAECEGDESPKHGGIGLRYSSDWLVAGPIIERERIAIWWAKWDDIDSALPVWGASRFNEKEYYGATPLIAAMRCYVASKLGDEIEIVKED